MEWVNRLKKKGEKKVEQGGVGVRGGKVGVQVT